MTVLFDDSLDVSYGFIHLQPSEAEAPDLVESIGGQANGLCGAAFPGTLTLITGLNHGTVPLRLELHEGGPAVGEEWEDVVEAPLTIVGEDYVLCTFDAVEPVQTPPAGTYRARLCAWGMDESRTPPRGDDEPDGERYLLQLWPAPLAGDAVIRRGSEQATSWHSVAAETAPPPAPPTPEELAEQRAEQERADAAARAAWEADLDAERWGGAAPSPRLRSIGGRTAQLAGLDRPLVELLAGLPAHRQRRVAVWAARQACELAGVAGLDWVRGALEAATAGTPLPPPWDDWSAVWERLHPEDGDPALVGEVVVGSEARVHRPLDPAATAVDAVQEAGAQDPARAVMGAVDALGRGQQEPGVFLDDLRRRLGDGSHPAA